jgi:hypothetical protein
VPILSATGAGDDIGQRAEALALLCAGDQARSRSVQRSMRRLRRNERPPGAGRRLLWWLEQRARAGTTDDHQ